MCLNREPVHSNLLSQPSHSYGGGSICTCSSAGRWISTLQTEPVSVVQFLWRLLSLQKETVSADGRTGCCLCFPIPCVLPITSGSDLRGSALVSSLCSDCTTITSTESHLCDPCLLAGREGEGSGTKVFPMMTLGRCCLVDGISGTVCWRAGGASPFCLLNGAPVTGSPAVSLVTSSPSIRPLSTTWAQPAGGADPLVVCCTSANMAGFTITPVAALLAGAKSLTILA